MNRKWNQLFLTTIFAFANLLYNSFSAVSYCDQKRNKVMPISVSGIEVQIELATTPDEQILGLMYRDKLEDNGGMLFIFPRQKILSFWMKDTRIPLSIAFIKADGRITQIESM